MEQRLLDLIHDARRWTDSDQEYLPTLGCSKCKKPCMPLCGLGLKRKISPMETKQIVLESRKTIFETGKTINPMPIQFVSGADIVIMTEQALDSVEQRVVPGHGKQWIFTQPIPTMAGLICRDCETCSLCLGPCGFEVRHRGKKIKVCVRCSEECKVCRQPVIRHHACCAGLGRRYLC